MSTGKRFVCLAFLALTACLVLLCGCEKTQPQGDAETASDAVTSDTADGKDGNGADGDAAEMLLALVENGSPCYNVVYLDGKYQSAATDLQEQLKSKIGVDFKLYKFIPNDGKRNIIVGSDYREVHPDEKPLPYDGYALVLDGDGNICACAQEAKYMSQCLQRFGSNIISSYVSKNDGGMTECYLPTSTLTFEHRASHSNSDASLFGVPIYDFRVVISSSASGAEQAAADVLCENLAAKTGYRISCVTDAETAAENEIVLGSTSRSASTTLFPKAPSDMQYRIKSSGGSIYCVYGSFLAMCEGMNDIQDLLANKTDVTVSVDKTVEDSFNIAKAEGSSIRIMTRNVLFGNGETPIADYTKRAALTAEIFRTYQPDFVGMQEADYQMYPLITSAVADIYTPIRAGCFSILYRTDTWRLEGDVTVHNFSNSNYYQGDAVWGYVWGLFENINTGEKIVMMNLHYHYRSAEDRMPEVEVVNAELKRIKALYPDVTIAVTGDYNCNSSSSEYAKMIEGTDVKSGMLLTTDSNNGYGGGIDHISLTENTVDVKRHRAVTYNAFINSSDHYAFFVDFSIKKSS